MRPPVASPPPPLAIVLRRSLPTVLLLGGASALLLATDRAGANRAVPAVAVLQQVSTSLLDDAVTGMIAGLAERGYVEGSTVTIRRYNAEGDLAQANAIAREIAGGPFDLALTSSTPSLQALATANDRGRILHVFSAVADPFSAGVGFDRADPLVHPRHLVGYGSLAPGDTTVSSVIDSVIAAAAKAGVPVFTVVPGSPDRGTLFDVGFDFREVGLLAGRLAGDLLRGTDPATVPIGETAREIPPRLTINLTAPGYDHARWRVPAEFIRQAKVVIDADGRRDQPGAILSGPFTEAETASSRAAR
jgi:ABC-type uncharacterized transport system substrate-binding protein